MICLRQRFAREETASVAIMFALALVPTMLLIGAGIDYARAVTERSILQSGVDAAVLAGIQQVRSGKVLSDATTTMSQVVSVNDPGGVITQVTMSANGSTLCVTAASTTPTTLMAIAGYKKVAVSAYACSALQLDTYEIAFAIDNSGSMGNSAQSNSDTKLTAAVKAANGLITALSPTTGSIVLATYSLVPFNSLVDIGSQYVSASFMDTAGQSSIHWQNFLRPAKVSGLPTSKFDMFKSMATAWGGCVEERPAPYTTTDTKASTSFQDTLFVPYLWPDETDGPGSTSPPAQTNPLCSILPILCAGQTSGTSSTLTNSSNKIMNNYLADEGGTCKQGDASDVADVNSGTGDGQTKLCKYKATPVTTVKNFATGGTASPNAGCSTIPLQPLNATTSVTTGNLKLMAAGGDTDLATGVMWAWRTISPNGPFGNGGNSSTTSGQQAPKAYNAADANGAINHKIIILLTDGMNHWYGMQGDSGYAASQNDPNRSAYNAFGWFSNGRLGQTDATTARQRLDDTTLSACSNAKSATDANGKPAPVEIYTVGFLATDGIDQQGLKLLANCATQDGGHSFIAQTGDELVSVFKQIAANITAPRIAK